MEYRVVNKEGRKALINYVCFGALQMVDAWYHELRHAVSVYEPNGDRVDWRGDDTEKEVVDGSTYIRGFKPMDFLALQYIMPEGEGTDLFIQYHEELLQHPLFEGITVDNDDRYMFASIEMSGRQMDATLYPMFFIRNLCQYTWVINSFKKAIESGATPIEAFFIASIIGISYGVQKDKAWYSMDGGDSSIIHSNLAPFGDLIEGIKGEIPHIYSDLKWEETAQGYSSYGTYATPYRSWDDEDWDEDEDEDDEWEADSEPEGISLPIHPNTGQRALVTSSSALRKPAEYPEHLRVTLSSIRPTNDEEFVEFVRKVSQYVKD